MGKNQYKYRMYLAIDSYQSVFHGNISSQHILVFLN